jgi:Ribonuclease D
MKFAQTITSEEIEKMEMVSFLGEISVVSNPDSNEFYQAIEYLKNQQVIGFDTETKPCFVPKVPKNKMAILQLAGADKAYIFRLQQVGVPNELAEILMSEKILKIGAAVHDDIKGLRAYNNFTAAGFIDLQKLAPSYGIEEKSVRKMAAIILNKRVSKSQQLSNWESSQLSDAQLRYAAVDAWVCREMYFTLIDEGE